MRSRMACVMYYACMYIALHSTSTKAFVLRPASPASCSRSLPSTLCWRHALHGLRSTEENQLDKGSVYGVEDPTEFFDLVRTLRSSKAAILDELDVTEGVVTSNVQALCDTLTSMNPVRSPSDSYDLLEGSWLHASAPIYGQARENLCDVEDVMASVTNGAGLSIKHSIETRVSPFVRVTDFIIHGEGKKPVMTYMQYIVCHKVHSPLGVEEADIGNRVKVAWEGSAPKISKTTMEWKHGNLSLTVPGVDPVSLLQGGTEENIQPGIEKHLFTIAYLDQDTIIGTHTRGHDDDKQELVVMVKRSKKT